MEDALRDLENVISKEVFGVLILVLMEDALREECYKSYRSTDYCVLILVLMEDALRESNFYSVVEIAIIVLILVLMEDALRELILRRVECQLVTTLFFWKIRLIFEEKVYLTACKYTNFPNYALPSVSDLTSNSQVRMHISNL